MQREPSHKGYPTNPLLEINRAAFQQAGSLLWPSEPPEGQPLMSRFPGSIALDCVPLGEHRDWISEDAGGKAC